MTKGIKPYGFACSWNSVPSSQSWNSPSVHTSTTVCSVLLCRPPGRRLAGRGPSSASPPPAPGVVPQPPGVQPLHVRRRNAHPLLARVPGDLVGGVPQDGAVDLVVEVHLVEVVGVVRLAQGALGAARPLQLLRRAVRGVDQR